MMGSERDWKYIARRFTPLALLLLFVAAIYTAGLHKHLTFSALTESKSALDSLVEAHPVLAPVAFLLFYAIAVAASFPAASLLTVFGGFLFGWIFGGALVLIAATAGSTVLFLAARTACGDLLQRRLGGRTASLASGFRDGAFGYLLVLRLAPVVPFWMVNIVAALVNVRIGTFIAATALGIIPGTFAYAYLGCGLESALVAAEAADQSLRLRDLVTSEVKLAFAALALVAVLALALRRVRGAS
ncbi:TVP38/TMEM64 family protein [Chelativorans sp. Marseille-P2723]|uniref:TVP38/TMEM64 family protein n=1 Tax=Chelativorans sp. Marseille-P2723 TaxID=2709133 RepID=UPI001FEE5B90|nr:TVP38/TMEM64 family protein [Chelativorans sp. Marseille-P2723]